MEELIYRPFRAKVKLNFSQMVDLSFMIEGYRNPQKTLEERAIMEWALKKSLQIRQRLIERKNSYTLSFNAQEALMIISVLRVINPKDHYHVVSYRIINEIMQMV